MNYINYLLAIVERNKIVSSVILLHACAMSVKSLVKETNSSCFICRLMILILPSEFHQGLKLELGN